MTKDLIEYLEDVDTTKFKTSLGKSGGYINFTNSGQRGSVKEFTLSLASVLAGLEDIHENIGVFKKLSNYAEKDWRDAGARYFKDIVLNSMITVQTKPTFSSLSKIINWANNQNHLDDNKMLISEASIQKTIVKLKDVIYSYSPKKHTVAIPNTQHILLSKPFLLLAGISGTGKTRFVRKQAAASAEHFNLKENENLCLVPVRPDWHEPSDLLGYISRLDGISYVATDFLKFMVKALCHAIESVNGNHLIWKGVSEIAPYWLCLDEMNLAPVEQYFADYLSILETREWNGDDYSSHALLPATVFKSLAENNNTVPQQALLTSLLEESGLSPELEADLSEYFINNGIPLPPNLIVAGTVNMDETTHGFSRKVIDRALSIDFGKFYPNDFTKFCQEDVQPKRLSFPTLSAVDRHDLSSIAIDPDGTKTIEFLTQINAVLKDTPFELAYRALNELLLSVLCAQPKDERELQAVWDDFLMCKVLPRIEGDEDKLAHINGDHENILKALSQLLGSSTGDKPALFADIWQGEHSRPDLLRENANQPDEAVMIPCRTSEKLDWMANRLEKNTFTSFWP